MSPDTQLVYAIVVTVSIITLVLSLPSYCRFQTMKLLPVVKMQQLKMPSLVTAVWPNVPQQHTHRIMGVRP